MRSAVLQLPSPLCYRRHMAVSRDDDAGRVTRTQELLRRLRHQADVSKEERRVVSESMAERAVEAKRRGARAMSSATKRSADTSRRIGRK